MKRNNLKNLIIDRAKGNGEIPSQIDTSAKEFGELEEYKEIAIGKAKELIPDHLKEKAHFARRKWEFEEESTDPW